jgi:hypothetical protein
MLLIAVLTAVRAITACTAPQNDAISFLASISLSVRAARTLRGNGAHRPSDGEAVGSVLPVTDGEDEGIYRALEDAGADPVLDLRTS